MPSASSRAGWRVVIALLVYNGEEFVGSCMESLATLDQVAYVRFASVYMDFKDVQEFMSELKNLLKDRAVKK